MFLGTFEPNMMDSGRIALPKKIREKLTDEVMVLTIGFEECIFGFSKSEWQEITKQELTRPLFSDKEGRDLRRKMYADAVDVQLDSQGRFIIPKNMMIYAKIDKQVVVIGSGDHFEIWDKKIWEEYRQCLRK